LPMSESTGPPDAAATDRDGARDTGSRARALVTGGAVRVGRQISLALARAGYDVAVHYNRSVEDARRMRTNLEMLGAQTLALQADLARPEEIEALFAVVGDRWGSLDLLVNNAAVFPGGAPESIGLDDWDHVFALNLRAPFFCAVRARALMTRGAIINIADIAAWEAWPGHVPYAASKAGLVSLTLGLAQAWAPDVRVNAVAPGAVMLPEGASDEKLEQAERRALLHRVGTPEDVAEAVVFLAGAKFVTGEILRVDGGAHVARSR